MEQYQVKYRENKYLAVQMLDKNIKNIIERINKYSPNVGMHCVYTAIYASTIAEILGYEDSLIHQITAGSLIHDLGKIFIPTEILNKTTSLTQKEFEIIKYHPQFGYIQIENLFGPVIRDIVLLHHEKLDGNGYPKGITQIPEYVQIVTVADEYDALTSERCYKKTFSFEQALMELKEDVHKGKLNEKIVNVICEGWLHDMEKYHDISALQNGFVS
ncbi:hD domain protein [Firmicutes bacterium CAG:95]|nr:hD domain protein [Firmicutes bacterium CAG:95]